MAFLTLEDPNAKIKGSRDPLGAQPIWASFARHIVTNLTTQTTSVRGFTTLLLGRYFAARLIEQGAIHDEDVLDVFLRTEQLCAYARHVVHGVEGDIRGIERVKAFLSGDRGKVHIQADKRGFILSDQKIYGLWGLYSVSARTSGFIPDGPIGLETDAVSENLRDRLQDRVLTSSTGDYRRAVSSIMDWNFQVMAKTSSALISKSSKTGPWLGAHVFLAHSTTHCLPSWRKRWKERRAIPLDAI